MSAEHQRVGIGKASDDVTPSLSRLHAVKVEGSGRKLGYRKLQWCVGHVTGDQSRFALRLDQHRDVPRCVAGCWYQRDFVGDAVIGFDEVDQAGLDQRLDRRFDHVHMVIGPGVLDLGTSEQVPRIWERWRRRTVDGAQVPSDMVEVQVGAQHRVDGAEPALYRRVETIGEFEVVGERSIIFSDASIDNDRRALTLDNEAVDRQGHLVVAIREEVGHEPVAMRLEHGWLEVWHQHRGIDVGQNLFDAGDDNISNGPLQVCSGHRSGLHTRVESQQAEPESGRDGHPHDRRRDQPGRAAVNTEGSNDGRND